MGEGEHLQGNYQSTKPAPIPAATTPAKAGFIAHEPPLEAVELHWYLPSRAHSVSTISATIGSNWSSSGAQSSGRSEWICSFWKSVRFGRERLHRILVVSNSTGAGNEWETHSSMAPKKPRKRGLPAKGRLTFSGVVEETLTFAVVWCSEGTWILGSK